MSRPPLAEAAAAHSLLRSIDPNRIDDDTASHLVDVLDALEGLIRDADPEYLGHVQTVIETPDFGEFGDNVDNSPSICILCAEECETRYFIEVETPSDHGPPPDVQGIRVCSECAEDAINTLFESTEEADDG